MTDAIFTGPWTDTATPGADAAPAPVPFGAPVLIADCATPLAGDTLLALLWRRLDGVDPDAQR